MRENLRQKLFTNWGVVADYSPLHPSVSCSGKRDITFTLLCIEAAAPVLKINDHATGGRRTKDILGGPKGWGPKKKVANVEIYVIFEVFAFCGGRTKTDFKDRGLYSGRYCPTRNVRVIY